eukprot:11168761-Lingulodinium_polyedra.AAC.1
MTRGINNAFRVLEAKLGPAQAFRRGETVSEFFQGTRCNRRHGERVADFITHFDEGARQFADDNVAFSEDNHVL